MANTIPTDKWGFKESADWWSAGQAARQQLYGAATEMMLDLAGVQAGSRVLDVAAGTGESALMAARRVGLTGYVLATDNSSSMLDVAAQTAREEGLTNVETRVMNAEKVELDPDSFDAVICRVALILFPNPAKALTEMRRVAKSGGKVAVMVYAALEKNPFWGIFIRQFAAWETYPRRRRANPGCSHWEIRERSTKSTGGQFFECVGSRCSHTAATPVGRCRRRKHAKRRR
ncbi:MAG: methyltransferase domain-containing protein [Candidatus Binatia bacterium]